MNKWNGRCLCGAITYSLAKAPLRTTICFCRFCQRATGGAEMTLPVLPKTDFGITDGSPSTYTHVSEGSGKEIYIHFCETCGTKLFVTFQRWSDMVGLYSGTLDDPAAIDLDPAKTKQIFVSSARPGTIIHAGIPAFWDHATDLDGAPQPSFVLDVPTRVEDVKVGRT